MCVTQGRQNTFLSGSAKIIYVEPIFDFSGNVVCLEGEYRLDNPDSLVGLLTLLLGKAADYFDLMTKAGNDNNSVQIIQLIAIVKQLDDAAEGNGNTNLVSLVGSDNAVLPVIEATQWPIRPGFTNSNTLAYLQYKNDCGPYVGVSFILN